MKPVTTVISVHSGRPITVVQEEFSPHAPTSSAAEVVDHVPSQPTVSAIPPPASTPILEVPEILKSSSSDIDFTDPFNITRNVFYGSLLPEPS